MRGRSGGEFWPVLLLLLAAVLAPTICVLWFMKVAIANERFAVREKLAAAYRAQLQQGLEQIESFRTQRRGALNDYGPSITPAENFARIVRDGLADSVLIYGEDDQLLYPILPQRSAASEETDSEQWDAAWTLEFNQGEPAWAADIYDQLVKAHQDDPPIAARALLARARALAKANRTSEALVILAGTLPAEPYREVRNARGNMLAPEALLAAAELIANPEDPQFQATTKRLAAWINDYSEPLMPSPQRIFLMERLSELAPAIEPMPPFEAERLALRAFEAGLPPLSERGIDGLHHTNLADVFYDRIGATRRLVPLYRWENLAGYIQSVFRETIADDAVEVQLWPPGHKHEANNSPALVVLDRIAWLPGGRLELALVGDDPLGASAGRWITLYLWTGILTVLAVGVLALLTGRMIGRQMRLTRLKNDFIATVTHELKTPLASMRVLVDTLREGTVCDENQSREYLELIARENVRLSRLIDNFLTFSRMERNKHAFELKPVEVREIFETAAEAVRERFEEAGVNFIVDAAPGLPALHADRDALVTVLLNLLDNAYKYSGQDKQIALRAYKTDNKINLEVQDNGIGLSRRSQKKIFERFYQVDQSLSREAGGCGLGLSIVQFIVTAHGGEIIVESEPGLGSKFSILLPAG